MFHTVIFLKQANYPPPQQKHTMYNGLEPKQKGVFQEDGCLSIHNLDQLSHFAQTSVCSNAFHFGILHQFILLSDLKYICLSTCSFIIKKQNKKKITN